MFDIGFSELMVIAVVALIVIGPERLPKVARTAGLLSGRLRRYVGDVKADISREMQLEELKRMQQEVADRVMSAEISVKQEIHSVTQEVNSVVEQSIAGTVSTTEMPSTANQMAEPITPSQSVAPVTLPERS
ncbi:MAG: twin-arginine translocase subunit TatB [Rhodocyclales bacterium]|jgi:sec-independent protein translocase protein TatB|nr:twin-arginine translocase subunit TatB [Rhodocyclales bacterium]MBH1975450.1 twin-arginine translocase subunit TatB [Rhodocyclales bacterium]